MKRYENCKICIKEYATKKFKFLKDKKPNLAQRAPLETITTIKTFELITIDYLLLDYVMNRFTNFAKTFTTKTKSGRSSAEALFSMYFLDLGFQNKFCTTRERNLTILV